MEHERLLVISHHYLTFIKDQITFISKNFEHIDVLVRSHWYYYLSKQNELIDPSGIPANTNVSATSIFYIPTDSQYKKLGELHLKNVEKKIKKEEIKFDLVHSHSTWSAGYVGAKLKEKYNVPFIVTAHGYDIYDLPFRDNEWKEKIKYVLDAADYVITVSNSNLEFIRKLGNKTPAIVIPNGFRKDLFFPRDPNKCRKKLNLPVDKKIILTIGNLVEVKGHKYLIDAMCKIKKSRRDVLCIIVGGGKLKNKLQNQINKYELENYVKLVGGKDHNEIPTWINACDLFVLPSLNEGNPTVMFECLGCGKPFVGTNVGGIPEIIINKELGYIIEPANSDALANAIINALEKKWDEKYIFNYAKQYTWDNIVREILEIYNEVLEKK